MQRLAHLRWSIRIRLLRILDAPKHILENAEEIADGAHGRALGFLLMLHLVLLVGLLGFVFHRHDCGRVFVRGGREGFLGMGGSVGVK